MKLFCFYREYLRETGAQVLFLKTIFIEKHCQWLLVDLRRVKSDSALTKTAQSNVIFRISKIDLLYTIHSATGHRALALKGIITNLPNKLVPACAHKPGHPCQAGFLMQRFRLFSEYKQEYSSSPTYPAVSELLERRCSVWHVNRSLPTRALDRSEGRKQMDHHSHRTKAPMLGSEKTQGCGSMFKNIKLIDCLLQA